MIVPRKIFLNIGVIQKTTDEVMGLEFSTE